MNVEAIMSENITSKVHYTLGQNHLHDAADPSFYFYTYDFNLTDLLP